MAWINSGGIEFYSISDTISSLTTIYFKFLISLFNPFIGLSIILFLVTLIVYFFYIIKKKLEGVEVLQT